MLSPQEPSVSRSVRLEDEREREREMKRLRSPRKRADCFRLRPLCVCTAAVSDVRFDRIFRLVLNPPPPPLLFNLSDTFCDPAGIGNSVRLLKGVGGVGGGRGSGVT